MQKRSLPASSLWLDRSGSSSLTIATEKSGIAHWNLRSGPGQCTIDQSLFNRDPHLKLSGFSKGMVPSPATAHPRRLVVSTRRRACRLR